MKHKQIAARLREIAGREPTYITHELLRLAHDLEQTPDPVGDLSKAPVPEEDMEALVRATQPPTRSRRGVLHTLLYGRRR